jgi:hypothetical protein
MFAHQLDEYYEDPVLIIKTAWGGTSLAEDFRPPSAGGTTGEFYNAMIRNGKGCYRQLRNRIPQYRYNGFRNFRICLVSRLE